MAIYYLDLEAGSDAADGTSFANRVKTWAVASGLLSPGDTLRVMASLGAVAMSVNAVWVNGSYKTTLSGAVNADVSTGQTAWTASANVTCTTSTTRKSGAKSASIAAAAGFTTGLAAYEAMSSTDYSGYQQISFWIMQTAGTLGIAASLSVKLCSDAAGATPVDTMDLPAIPALNVWVPVVINKGSALGSAIQSVAFVINTDNAAQTFLIDNIVAVKASGNADELHHKMLIGKQNSIGGGGNDTQTWYPIRSIRGTVVNLDSDYAKQPDNDLPTCCNSSETVTAYTFTPSYAPTAVVVGDTSPTFMGVPGTRITVSGGWNRTDMSTQTGYTIFAHPNGNSIAPTIRATATDLSKTAWARWGSNVSLAPCNLCTVDLWQAVGCVTAIVGGCGNTVTNSAVCVSNAFNLQGPGSTYTFLADVHNANATISSGATATFSSGSVISLLTVTAGTGVATHDSTTYGGFTGSGLDAAATRAAIGLAAANLGTQLDALPTNAELATALGTADDAVLTQIAAVKAKTDNLPSDPADTSDIAASFSTVNTTLGTIAGYIDTEVSAIKAKTDLIPASPAAVGSAMILSSTGLDSVVVELGLNARQALSIAASALGGVLAGAATTTVTIAAAGVPATNRVTATVDSNGNRSAVTLSLPA